MKRLFTWGLVIALAMMSLSCAKENGNNGTDSGKEQTRTATFNATSEVADPAFGWKVGDAVALHFGLSSSADASKLKKFEVKSVGSDGSAEISGLVVVGQPAYFASYPYDEANFVNSKGVMRLSFNSDQKASAPGAMDKSYCPMAAELADGNYDFRSIGGFAGFTLSQDNVTKVTLTANDSGTVGGVYNISFDAEGELSVELSQPAAAVSLTPSSSSAFAAGKYFIALPAREYKEGMTVSLTLTDGSERVNELPMNLSIVRSRVTDLGTFSSVMVNTYTVTFNTNCAEKIDPVTVAEGETVARPADPVSTGGITAGLYEGVIDPDAEAGSATFAGWYTDPDFNNPYDFSTPVTSDLTLYAKWDGTAVSPVDVSTGLVADKGLLCQAMSWINAQRFTEKKTFTYVVTADDKWQNQVALSNPDVDFYLVGQSQPRVLSQDYRQGSKLIYCQAGHIYLGKNITISGNYGGTDSAPVYVHNYKIDGTEYSGNITMLAGSKIADCTNDWRGAVYVNDGNGSFTLDGGEIVGNTITCGAVSWAGAIALNWGKVYIKSGKIADNTVVSTEANVSIGGGISVLSRTQVVKTGGVIENNKASYDGVNGIYKGQQVCLTTISGGQISNPYAINDNVPESTSFDTKNVENEGSVMAPWEKIN